MNRPTVTPLSTALGAQISGIDIRQPLSLEDRDIIEQALLEHQVLFFRDQPIEPVPVSYTHLTLPTILLV